MNKKYQYINNDKKINKTEFLQEFAEANKILEEDYKNYKIDKISEKILMKLDIEKIISKRKENANIIYHYLEQSQDIEYIRNTD